jgi:hypothetical protein
LTYFKKNNLLTLHIELITNLGPKAPFLEEMAENKEKRIL